MATRDAARAAKMHLAQDLTSYKYVNGVGLSKASGQWVVKVNMSTKHSSTLRHIPESIDGVPVIVEVVGDLSAQAG